MSFFSIEFCVLDKDTEYFRQQHSTCRLPAHRGWIGGRSHWIFWSLLHTTEWRKLPSSCTGNSRIVVQYCLHLHCSRPLISVICGRTDPIKLTGCGHNLLMIKSGKQIGIVCSLTIAPVWSVWLIDLLSYRSLCSQDCLALVMALTF